MIKDIAIIVAIELMIGMIITTSIAIFRPKRLIDEHKNFRYSLALIVTGGWPLSVLFFIAWALTWPPRHFVRRGVDAARREQE